MGQEGLLAHLSLICLGLGGPLFPWHWQYPWREWRYTFEELVIRVFSGSEQTLLDLLIDGLGCV
jgi:hypothetical protein